MRRVGTALSLSPAWRVGPRPPCARLSREALARLGGFSLRLPPAYSRCPGPHPRFLRKPVSLGLMVRIWERSVSNIRGALM